MSLKEWGNITWILFHSLAEKVNRDKFNIVKNHLIHFIKYTCENLPCSICANHATNILKKSNINMINTKGDLIEFLRQFHNIVNKKTNKEIIDKLFVIKTYKNANIINIVNNFKKIYSKKYGNFTTEGMLKSNKQHQFNSISSKQLDFILKFCY